MALDASKKIKNKFGETIKFEEFTLDSEQGKAFNVKTSSNVFVNGKLLHLKVWTDQNSFEDYVQKIISKDSKRKNKPLRLRTCDVVIIGGGPAGQTAGIYCSRAKLSSILLEKENLGGQVKTTHTIENYPGFIEYDASQLIENMEKQARQFGLEIQTFKKVDKVEFEDEILEDLEDWTKIEKKYIV